MYLDKDLKEHKQHQLIHQFSERKINYRDFYIALFDNLHPFYDGNGRTCKILIYLKLGM